MTDISDYTKAAQKSAEEAEVAFGNEQAQVFLLWAIYNELVALRLTLRDK